MKHIFLAMLVACFAGCHPPGQKLLSLEIQQAGEVILSTTFDVVDTSTGAEIWDETGEAPFSTGVNLIEPSSITALTADIEGPVGIRILWTNSVEFDVTLKGLQLIRSAPGTEDWHLPSAEIRRAKAAAGL